MFTKRAISVRQPHLYTSWFPCVSENHTKFNDIQGVSLPFKTQTNCNHVLRYRNEIRIRSTPRVTLSPKLPRDTRVKVSLVARPLLTPVARKLCRYEHGVFISRTRVHSRTLLRIEIVFCGSRSI
jgi:hypothetical protein